MHKHAKFTATIMANTKIYMYTACKQATNVTHWPPLTSLQVCFPLYKAL